VDPAEGDWAVVVMNADASRDVAVTMTAGAEVTALPWVIGIMLSIAGTGLLLAALLVMGPALAVSRDRRAPA
jgi:hypothetical protein